MEGNKGKINMIEDINDLLLDDDVDNNVEWQKILLKTTHLVDIRPYLTQREFIILRLRNEQNLTLEETGKVFGVTRERVRQVEAKALRKLENRRKEIICEDLWEQNEKIREQYEKELNELEFFTTKIKGVNEWIKNNAPQDVKQTIEEMYKYNDPRSIDELDLSTRAYSCLKRARINTIQDLKEKKLSDLMKIRNMGRKSLQEIISQLNGLKIKLKQEEIEEIEEDEDDDI